MKIFLRQSMSEQEKAQMLAQEIEVVTYPEMDGQIVEILRLHGGMYALYAAQRIEELEQALREEQETSLVQQKALDEKRQVASALVQQLVDASDLVGFLEGENAELTKQLDSERQKGQGTQEAASVYGELEQQLKEAQARQHPLLHIEY